MQTTRQQRHRPSHLSLKLLAVVALGLLGIGGGIAQECDAFDYAATTVPVMESVNKALRTADRALREQPENADVLLMGDSLMEGWPAPLLAGAFPGQKVANYGVGFQRVANVLWRLPYIAQRQSKPKLVVLWVGTNDLSMGEKPCAVEQGLMTAIEAVRATWPTAKLIVLGIAPRGVMHTFKPADVAAVNSALSHLQLSQGFRFISVDASLRCFNTQTDPLTVYVTKSADGESPTCKFFLPDNTHLSAEGYASMDRLLRSHSPL